MAFYVYILASKRNGTLYLGYTDELPRRIAEHRDRLRPNSFSARYGVTRLVWFQAFDTREDAWDCERRMKTWRRAWKLNRIEGMNPGWVDLYDLL